MNIKTIIVSFSILPLIAAFFDSSFFKFVPVLILIFLFSINVAVNLKIFKIPKSFFFIIFVTLIHLLIQLLIGKGYGSGGLILLLLEALLIYQLINLYRDKIDFNDIITFFFIINLLFLYFEFFIRLFGYEFIFVDLFGSAENVAKFKTYNSAPWYIQALGFKGLNSFFLGSQIAGILSLLSSIYFLGKKYYLKQHNFKLNILIILSFTMYFMSMTQTTNLLFSLILIITFFFIPSFIGLKNNFLRLFIFCVSAMLIILFAEIILRDVIFFKLHEQKDIDIYLSLFFDPYNAYLNLNLDQILLGIGRSNWTFDATSDLGFFAILFRVGLPYFIVISIFVIFCIITSFKQSFNRENPDNLNFLFVVNSLFIFVYWGSLIHYTNSIELGCRELFAFQIAFFFTIIKNNFINDK